MKYEVRGTKWEVESDELTAIIHKDAKKLT